MRYYRDGRSSGSSGFAKAASLALLVARAVIGLVALAELSAFLGVALEPWAVVVVGLVCAIVVLGDRSPR
jgi:hypothetical protein